MALFFLSFGPISFAQDDYSCFAKSPLYLGASVTSELGRNIFYSPIVKIGNAIDPIVKTFNWGEPRAQKKYSPLPGIRYGKNPSALFVESIGGQSKGHNFAEPVTLYPSQLGSYQIEKLLKTPKLLYRIKIDQKANAILAIDLFYWDTIHNTCTEGQGLDPVHQLNALINYTVENNKFLFLSTVPFDKPSNVSIHLELSPWRPQNRGCLLQINSAIRQYCTVEVGCYYIDLYKINEEILAGSFERDYLDQPVSIDQVRPDGVHLSELGSELVAEEMRRVFLSDPPVCKLEK